MNKCFPVYYKYFIILTEDFTTVVKYAILLSNLVYEGKCRESYKTIDNY